MQSSKRFLARWDNFILPFFMLRDVQIRLRDKIIVGFILALAAAGGIASMIRFKYLAGLAEPGYSFYATTHEAMVWSCIEPGLGIIAGSLASLRPLLRLASSHFHTARSEEYHRDSAPNRGCSTSWPSSRKQNTQDLEASYPSTGKWSDVQSLKFLKSPMQAEEARNTESSWLVESETNLEASRIVTEDWPLSPRPVALPRTHFRPAAPRYTP